MIRYWEQRPSRVLANLLECFWFVSDTATLPVPAPERILPDGCLEWIFHLGTPFRRLTEAGDWEKQPRSFVVGELTRFLLVQPGGSAMIMGVRFRPGGAYRFLPLPLDKLSNRTIPTGDIWDLDGKHLEESVVEAHDNAERERLVEEFLMRRLAMST